MVTYDEFLKQYDLHSVRVSTLTRQYTLGLLAVMWALFLGSDKLFPQSGTFDVTLFHIYLITVGGIATVTLIFDFFQYLFSFKLHDKIIDRMEELGVKHMRYNYLDPLHKTCVFFFRAKQVALVVNVIIFFIFVFVFITAKLADLQVTPANLP